MRESDPDPNGRDADEAEPRDEVYERPVDRFARSAPGSVLAAGLLGLRDALEGRPEREQPVMSAEAPSPSRADGIEVVLDPDHPERRMVIIHRPAPATDE
jgi:hypothetical protein